MNKWILGSSILALAAAAALPSCVEKFGTDCAKTRTCKGDISNSLGGAAGSGGMPGAGGAGGNASGASGGASNGTAGEAGASNDCPSDCQSPKPVCDRGECVECTDKVPCEGEKLCDDRKCVECIQDARCLELDHAACIEGECSPCADDTQCERFKDTPVCDETSGTCVACTTDTEVKRCEGNKSCSSLTHTCTGTTRHIRDVCDVCESDSECATGRRCVMYSFNSADVGYRCFQDAEGGCGDTDDAKRPYSHATELTSIDGVKGSYCMPPDTTTCTGIGDYGTSCASDDECGMADQLDGYCPAVGTAASQCSYKCVNSDDCPEGETCGGSPQHCRPVAL
jgi:hypothetical protein